MSAVLFFLGVGVVPGVWSYLEARRGSQRATVADHEAPPIVVAIISALSWPALAFCALLSLLMGPDE